MAKVAFIGLGVMGFPMAGHLATKGGHEVTVYNRNAAKAKAWVEKFGGKSAANPEKAAAEGQDFVMCCVGNDDDLRSVTIGADGAFSGMTKGAIFVDHTTASAEVARELDAAATKAGFQFIDAPVSGGQAGAENGALTVMCGGTQAAYAKRRADHHVLRQDAETARSRRLRPAHQDGQPDLHRRPCRGTVRRHSLRQEEPVSTSNAVVEVISKGAAQSWQMENRHKTMNDGKFDFGFAVEWMRKDLSICPRRGPPQRRQPAGHGHCRSVLRRGRSARRQAVGHFKPLGKIAPVTI